MKTATPLMLNGGEWGVWVTGEDVQPGMLICVSTCDGKSVPSRVERVVSKCKIGAICDRYDVSDESDIYLEIPFLDQLKPNDRLDELILGCLQKWVYRQVEDTIGPAPMIDRYEYYEDFEIDRERYEFDAQFIIEDLGQTLMSLQFQATQDSLSKKIRREEAFKPGEANSFEADHGNANRPRGHKLQLYSSQPIWPMSYLRKTEPSHPFPRLYGPNSAY